MILEIYVLGNNNLDKKFQNVMAALSLLSEYKEFVNSLDLVFVVKAEKLLDVELVLCQVMIISIPYIPYLNHITPLNHIYMIYCAKF